MFKFTKSNCIEFPSNFLVLKSCFTLTPGYLNPALIIPAQKYIISLETGPEAL